MPKINYLTKIPIVYLQEKRIVTENYLKVIPLHPIFIKMQENINAELNAEVFKANEVIQNGGIILYPTDTVWGIGCDATNPEAVAKIYKLKQREETASLMEKK